MTACIPVLDSDYVGQLEYVCQSLLTRLFLLFLLDLSSMIAISMPDVGHDIQLCELVDLFLAQTDMTKIRQLTQESQKDAHKA